MAKNADWLLYGANGYTGQLLAREAVARGMRPTLGGRSRASLEPLGRELGCEIRTVGLDDPGLDDVLDRFPCVLNAAGPFSRTSRPLVDACLKAGCHYLDLTGEVDVMAACYARHVEALTAGIAVIPAVGFSVVPMDCLAAKLAAAIPRATKLELAFEGYELSPGCAKTYVEGIALGTAHRRDGRLERLPFTWNLRSILFKGGVQSALPVPYGELASCHRATQIGNISVFMVPPPPLVPMLKYGPRFSPLLQFGWAKRAVDRLAERRYRGPDAAARLTRRTQIWGRVIGGDGSELEGLLETAEPYQLTIATALSAVQRVLYDRVPSGAWSPSQAFGSDFLTEVTGSKIEWRPERALTREDAHAEEAPRLIQSA